MDLEVEEMKILHSIPSLNPLVVVVQNQFDLVAVLADLHYLLYLEVEDAIHHRHLLKVGLF